MSFDLQELRDAIACHGRVVRVVVADVQGSAPREVGASMLVWQGRQSGTIGGGRLEWDAAKDAILAFESGDWFRQIPLGPALGQCCGGSVGLLAEVFSPDRIQNLSDGHYLRQISGTADMPLAITRCLATARSTGLPISPMLQDGWFLEPIQRPTRPLWIFGAGHVGRAIVDVLAPMPEFEITWVDTAGTRFPPSVPSNVTKLVAADPASVVQYAPTNAGHLILTYSHALDLELCHQLLGHGFDQAGLIGSKTKWARFRSRLSQLGHTDAQISRIRCPIGQPELGKHPQAIAVGVAASLLSGLGKRESNSNLAG